MAKYGVVGSQSALATTFKTALIVNRGASKRVSIYDFIMGQGGTPADNAIFWQLQRSTADGTETAVTPQPLDGADGACVATAGSNATIEPTYTAGAVLFNMAVNQRASFRWVAAPDGALIIPNTAGAGIGALAKSAAYTGDGEAVLHFEE